MNPVGDNTILVVDDADLLRRTVRRILERQGYFIIEATDVPSARKMLQENQVGLVLCDVNMPGESGLTLVRDLRPRMPETAVVMVTSVDSTSVAVEALEAGAFGYILKPFARGELIIQVDNAMRRRMLEMFHLRTRAALRERVQVQTAKVLESREELALRLAAACAARTDETKAHIRRIGMYAAEMAQLLGWEEDEVEDLRVAATMHDVGKVLLPDAILEKHAPLNEAEFEIVRQHTIAGAEMLAGSHIPMLEVAERVARHHHERWDGSGYPDGLAGEDIPVEARMVLIADVYDSLVHERHFREPWKEDQSVAYLRERRGTWFDPELLDLFLENISLMRAIRLGNPD